MDPKLPIYSGHLRRWLHQAQLERRADSLARTFVVVCLGLLTAGIILRCIW